MIKALENVNGQSLCCHSTLCSDFSVWFRELVYLPSKKNSACHTHAISFTA